MGRPASWLPLNAINTAHHVLTQARGAALVDLLVSNPPPHLDPPVHLQGREWLDIGIHDLQLPALGLSAQARNDQVSDAVKTRLLQVVTDLEDLRLKPEHAPAWKKFEKGFNVRCNSRQSRSATVYALMPPAALPHLGSLFSRQVSLTETSYVTLAPSSVYVEVAFFPLDSKVLRLLAEAIQCERWRFTALLSEGFRKVWPRSEATVRFSNETRSETPNATGRGNSKYVDPGSSESDLILGMQLQNLLRIRRMGVTTVTLRLGFGDQRPVELQVSVPDVPRYALHALIQAAGADPIRLVPASGVLTRTHLVLAPLPGKWLGSFKDRALETERGIRVEQTLERALGTRAQLVVKPGGRPFALFLPFRDRDAVHALPILSQGGLLQSINLPTLGRELGLFETNLPLECLEVMGDKGFQGPLNALRAAGGQPPAAPGHA
mgnify:FL=1